MFRFGGGTYENPDDDNPSPQQLPPQQLPLVQTASAASAVDLEAGKGSSNGDAKAGMGRGKSLRDLMSPGSKKKVRGVCCVGGTFVCERIKDGWLTSTAHTHPTITNNNKPQRRQSVNQLGKRRWGEIAHMLVKALLPVIVINAVGVRCLFFAAPGDWLVYTHLYAWLSGCLSRPSLHTITHPPTPP